MTDPLDALREPLVPVDPDPRFAARLRALLEQALLGGAMSTTTDSVQGEVGYASVWTPEVERAEAFYGAVLGWRVQSGHHQVLGLRQHLGLADGQSYHGTFLSHGVTDLADTVRRIREAGGTAEEPTRQSYGLSALCADSEGLPFALHEIGPRPAADSQPGEIAYLTYEVVDSARARAFYSAVFGWTFSPGRHEDGWGVDQVRPMTGMHGGHDQPRVVPMYHVADIAEAVAAVDRAGGTAGEVSRQPYGLSALCADDQGTPFYLGQF
ncbi:VOC family protein [Kutzneria albida]|uniref:VOC domain-containing protein n=1 Tax=Kutzneria albida DSM 43870 TaxID=1449976 RepID=W5WJU7_9PSEU|nr:VOC family protein [Kutzneria albida]AHI00852.1 hypothetical protein KALB_7494 [Kutzneria albida DSM 43870]